MNSELIIDDVMMECCNWKKKRFGVLPVKSSGAITLPYLGYLGYQKFRVKSASP